MLTTLLFLLAVQNNGIDAFGEELERTTRVWSDYVHDAFQREMLQMRDRLAILGESVQYEVFEENGFDNIGNWDVYFSQRLACHETLARHLRPLQQQVNCLPGSEPMTRKRLYFQSLRTAFGAQLAEAITPLTFYIPKDYFLLASHIRGPDAPPAVFFKSEMHKGDGVGVVPAEHALGLALHEQLQLSQHQRPVLAQRLIHDQLLVGGRSPLLRIWLIVFGPDPIRAYMFKGSSIMFSKQVFKSEAVSLNNTLEVAVESPVESAQQQESFQHEAEGFEISQQQQWWIGDQAQPQPNDVEGGEGVWQDFGVNYNRSDLEGLLAVARRLSTLEERVVHSVGQAPWDAMWRQLEVSLAASVAAAVPKMRFEGRIFAAEAAGFSVADEEEPDLSHIPPGLPGDLGGFQVLGADVLLDSQLKPWIVEVNVPSVTYLVKPEDASKYNGGKPHECEVQRQEFLDGMLQLLLTRHRAGAQALAAVAAGSQAGHQQQPSSADLGGPGWVPAPEGMGSGNLSTQAVREATVQMALQEAATAAAHNFSVLTPLVYQALECMVDGGKGGAGSRQPPLCPVLQDLLQGPAQLPSCKDSAARSGVCGGYLHLQNRGAGQAGPALSVSALLASLLKHAQQVLGAVVGSMHLPAFQWGTASQHGPGFEFSESDMLFKAAMQRAAL